MVYVGKCDLGVYAVNPITQKYTDRDMETMVRDLETSSTSKVLNQAWDKQIQREAHFDVLTQQPKRGHIHEVLSCQNMCATLSSRKRAPGMEGGPDQKRFSHRDNRHAPARGQRTEGGDGVCVWGGGGLSRWPRRRYRMRRGCPGVL